MDIFEDNSFTMFTMDSLIHVDIIYFGVDNTIPWAFYLIKCVLI